VRVFTPLMLESAKKDNNYEGHIVNTASIAGLINAPTMGIYNVSKHAVVSLSETLHHDLQLIGAPVGTSVLCPYFVPTGINRSQRNRPDDVQNKSSPTASQLAADAVIDKAVSSGKITAAEVAEDTFDAIRQARFYIYSHPQLLSNVQTRMEDVVLSRNPTDPLQSTPLVREMLLSKLKMS
jgi:short-subunit dehydrogenase